MRFAKPRIYTPNRVVEVTTRCLQSRFLLRPSKEVNNEIIAVLARAQRLYGVSVHAFWFGSNHCHLLLSAESQWHISRFMGFTNGNIARRVGRLQRWRERFSCRRYQGIELTDEPQAAYQRLRYVLAQGCKEGLIDSPLDWPGVTSARALADGSRKLSGVWLDRTGLYQERVRRGVIGPRSRQLSRSERREANRKIDITEFEDGRGAHSRAPAALCQAERRGLPQDARLDDRRHRGRDRPTPRSRRWAEHGTREDPRPGPSRRSAPFEAQPRPGLPRPHPGTTRRVHRQPLAFCCGVPEGGA